MSKHNQGQILHRDSAGQFAKPPHQKKTNGATSAAADRKLQEEAYLKRGRTPLLAPVEMQPMDANALGLDVAGTLEVLSGSMHTDGGDSTDTSETT